MLKGVEFKMDSMNENLRQEQNADYRHYIATGNHYTIGKKTADKSGSLIRFGQRLNQTQIEIARNCKEQLKKHFPKLIDEFKGYQDALGLPEEMLLPHYSLSTEGGCSAIAIKTSDGMLVGRNYDFYYYENRRHLIKTNPESGYAHIGIHEGLVGGRFDGINEKGLFVCFNGAGSHPLITRTGISFHHIVRLLLEKCESAEEARDTLLSLPIKEPKSYLLADTNTAYVVEADIHKSIYREMDDGQIVMTNHFVHPEMGQKNVYPNSVQRFKHLSHIGRTIQGSATKMDMLKTNLADHTAPLCGHVNGLATFWSCVGNLSEMNMEYCLGAPCRNEYKRYFD